MLWWLLVVELCVMEQKKLSNFLSKILQNNSFATNGNIQEQQQQEGCLQPYDDLTTNSNDGLNDEKTEQVSVIDCTAPHAPLQSKKTEGGLENETYEPNEVIEGGKNKEEQCVKIEKINLKDIESGSDSKSETPLDELKATRNETDQNERSFSKLKTNRKLTPSRLSKSKKTKCANGCPTCYPESPLNQSRTQLCSQN